MSTANSLALQRPLQSCRQQNGQLVMAIWVQLFVISLRVLAWQPMHVACQQNTAQAEGHLATANLSTIWSASSSREGCAPQQAPFGASNLSGSIIPWCAARVMLTSWGVCALS